MLGTVPIVGAHMQSSSTIASQVGDPYRWHHTTSPTAGSYTDNTVSGNYVGSSGVALIGKTTFPINVVGLVQLCPLGYCATAAAECDLEVLGPGDGTTDVVVDESNVDGGTGNGGLVPDGTVDDGGQGAACHTDGYTTASYNTLGCSGASHARDAVGANAVTIMPGCDDSSQVSDGGPSTCFVNAVQQANPGDAVVCAGIVVSTVTTAVTCVPNQTCGAGIFSACGADGTTDEINIGAGGGPGAAGVAYPADLAACDSLSTAVTYVLSSVNVDSKTVTPAAGGWVDGTLSGGSNFGAPGAGTAVGPDLCADGTVGPVLVTAGFC